MQLFSGYLGQFFVEGIGIISSRLIKSSLAAFCPDLEFEIERRLGRPSSQFCVELLVDGCVSRCPGNGVNCGTVKKMRAPLFFSTV
jgi:hypothetical protein